MKRTLAFALSILMMCCAVIPQDVVAEKNDAASLPTHQMLYVNRFFNKDGSWSEMGLELCKWLDMSKRDTVDRINSGYLMLEEEYLYHQDTLANAAFVDAANLLMNTISSTGGNLVGMAINHFAMKTKFGDAGALAIPYYEYLSEIYLSFMQCLEKEMQTMDVAVEAIVSILGSSETILRESVPVAIGILEKTPAWNLLSRNQKYSLESAKKTMTTKYSTKKSQAYQNYVEEVGIDFDFGSTAASWLDAFTTKENLTIQQQLYMATLCKVTDEHLEVLYNLHEALHKQNVLSESELEKVDGAIGALICDISSARNGQMEAVAQAEWNAQLGTVNALTGAIYSTLDITGFNPIVNLAAKIFTDGKGFSAQRGFSAVTAVASVGSLVLSLTTQDYLDIRKQTRVLYNLKESMVESLKLQLSDYATNPSHEQAVAIIAGLKLLKQAKLSGEEAVAMYYIAREANMFGLENAPAAQAILWNELITCNELGGYDLGAKDYTESIWTVYQNKVGITSYYHDANTHRGNIQYKVISTPICHYSTSNSRASYQGVALDPLPTTFMGGVVSTVEWKPTEKYLRNMTLMPDTALVTIQQVGNEYTTSSETTMSQSELEKLAQSASGKQISPLTSLMTTKLENVNRVEECVYNRGNVEVRISVDEFEKYLVAEKQVEQLLNAYKNVSALEYTEHQTEERLIWTKVTNGYIESFPMYDPNGNYEETIQTPTASPMSTAQPTPAPTWGTSAGTFHYNNGFNTEAFAAELESGRLSLERVDLPGTEDIGWVKWLSVSPKGSCLLGAYSEGYGVYYVAEEIFIPLTFDTTGDEYGNLERFSKLALPKFLSFVWSPDERYFAVVNQHKVMANDLTWDLFVGDLTTNTFRVLDAWSSRLLNNGGAVYQACFDQSCEKLYYSFYGNVDNPLGSRFFTVEYDIATGESCPLFSNEWTDGSGNEYSCTYEGIHCLNDGRILQIAVRKDGRDFGISIMTPKRGSWTRSYFSTCYGNARGSNFQFSMVNDDFLTFTYYNMAYEYEEALYIGLQKNNLFDMENIFKDYEVGNTQISPDGKYVLSLMHSGSSYSLEVLDRMSKKFSSDIRNGGIKVDVPFDLRTNGAYLLGHNALAAEFFDGIQWGGNILLLGTRDGAKVYQFENVENTDSYPWPQENGLVGTIWNSQMPTGMTLSFPEKGIFELCMTAGNATLPGEYVFDSDGILYLTMPGQTIECTIKGRSIHYGADGNTVFFLDLDSIELPTPTPKPTPTPVPTPTPEPSPTPTPVPLTTENLVGYWGNGHLLFKSNGKAIVDGYNGTYNINGLFISFHYYDSGMDTTELMTFIWENNGTLTDSSLMVNYKKDNTPFEDEKPTPTPTAQPNSLEFIASRPWEESSGSFYSNFNSYSPYKKKNERTEECIDAEYLGKVITIREKSDAYFYFIAPNSGDYAISVKSPLAQHRCSLDFYRVNSENKLEFIKKAHFSLTPSDEIQTILLKNITKGERIYWRSFGQYCDPYEMRIIPLSNVDNDN